MTDGKWQQLDLFTGEPVEESTEATCSCGGCSCGKSSESKG